MLDYRILTFLKLCETMNYRITAEELNMTQPAVTQHIHYLEEEYKCKLFIYNRKKLEKTNQAILLEEYASSAYYNEIYLKRKIKSENKIKINIGATKTIGEFVIGEKIKKLVKNEKYDISLTIDNTEKLIKLMELNKLDFILVEGIFNKDKYGYRLYKKDDFIGICSKNHKFNEKSIKFEELFEEDIIIREEGSGTRGIFEQFLSENSFSLEFFKKKITINNFNLIKELVSANCGISFVYNSVVNKNDDIGKFYFKNKIEREFNYLYTTNLNLIQINYLNSSDYTQILDCVNTLYALLDQYRNNLDIYPRYVTDRFILCTENIYSVADSIYNMGEQSLKYYQEGNSEGVLIARVKASAKALIKFSNQLSGSVCRDLQIFLENLMYTDEEEYNDSYESLYNMNSEVVKTKYCTVRDIVASLCEISQLSLPLMFNDEVLIRVGINYLENVKILYPEISKYIMIMGKTHDGSIIEKYMPVNETEVKVDYLENELQVFTLEYDGQVCKMILPPANDVARHVGIAELYKDRGMDYGNFKQV